MCEQCFVQALKTTLIVWRQQNKGKDLFEEILNDIVKLNPLC